MITSTVLLLASLFGAVAVPTTTATVLTVGAAAAGAGLIGKGIYDSGRKRGHSEGQATIAAEIQAQRARLDEMEAGL
jgi:hypothetical protein